MTEARISETPLSRRFIQTDEAQDVIGSLRHVVRAAQATADDPLAYKWLLLGLHSALQGSCVCHLTSTAAPLGAVTKKNTVEWQRYFEESRRNRNTPPPKTYLLDLPNLLKAVRKPYSAGDRGNSAGIAINDSELAWLSRIHCDVRNQFVHFAPMSWSIEVSGIPELANLVARIIMEISSHNWAFRQLTSNEQDELRQNLEALQKIDW